MLTGESRSGRVLMGRLERGTELVRALRRVCADHSVRCAEVRAIGALESVEICAFDQKNRVYGPSRVFKGDLEILSVLGNVSEKHGELALHLHITVARETDNGFQVLGGHLVSAKVFACEFVLVTCDDLILRRGLDKATGLPLWRDKIEFAPGGEESPAEKSEPETGSGPETVREGEPTWKDVMQAAMEEPPVRTDEGEGGRVVSDSPAEKEEEPSDWVEPQVGDVLHHPTFGRVTVEREEGEFVHVRLTNDRLIRLSLAVLELRLVGHEDGRQLFEARVVRH